MGGFCTASVKDRLGYGSIGNIKGSLRVIFMDILWADLEEY
jgi:hypothetical protein